MQNKKKFCQYISYSSYRYAIFGLSCYLLYNLFNERKTLSLLEAIKHFIGIAAICMIIGIVISSISWFFIQKNK